MANSMTAYGRAQSVINGKGITVELKSVNNRYLDCSVRLPRAYSFLEERVKTYLQQSGVSRGKVEVNITVDRTEAPAGELKLNTALAAQYVAALRQLCDEFDLTDDITTMNVATNRELFVTVSAPEDESALFNELQPVLAEALSRFLAARKAEGENLTRDLLQKKAHLVELAAQVAARSKEGVSLYRARLEEKLRQTLADTDLQYDEARILTECAIFADRVAVDEELVRLSSHFDAFDRIFAAEEPIGRKLDFLLQEMNRETNTIGSKACDLTITATVIEMKNELEKIREQIQNLE